MAKTGETQHENPSGQVLSRHVIRSVNTRDEAFELSRLSFPDLRDFRFYSGHDAHLTNAEVSFAGIGLLGVRSSGHDIQISDNERLTVIRPVRGSVRVKQKESEVSAKPGELAFIGTGQRLSSVSEGFSGLVVKVPEAVLVPRLDHEGDRRAAQLVDMRRGEANSGATEALGSYLDYLVSELDRSDLLLNDPVLARSSRDLLLDLIGVQAFVDDDVAETRTGVTPAYVRKAEEFIRANSERSINLADIAEAVEVSARALQLGFRTHRDTTPTAFLLDCRLDRVRAHLLAAAPDQTVTGILYENGVTHLGRFAERYRRRFGELPSQTLARTLYKS